jgi:hypothetical protein
MDKAVDFIIVIATAAIVITKDIRAIGTNQAFIFNCLSLVDLMKILQSQVKPN